MAFARLIESGEPLGDPFLLTADCFWIIAARNADADGVVQARAVLKQVRAPAVDFRVFLVPENVAPCGKMSSASRSRSCDLRASAMAASASIRVCAISLAAPEMPRTLRPKSFGPGFTGWPRPREIGLRFAVLIVFGRILGIGTPHSPSATGCSPLSV
jgi:hypothetical protein